MEQTSDESASNASGQEFGLCDDNLQRYSRSTLYSLRNTAKSSQRPKCFYNLQSLTCWKFTSAQHNKSSYDSLNVRPKLHAGERTAVDLPSENQTQPGLSNKRSLRSRERQIRFQLKRGGNNSEDESTTTSHSHQNNQTPLTPKQQIDQRSISSAHLLPAFAKRRLGMPAGGEYSSASHSGSDTRPETPSSSKYDHETRMRSSIHDSKQDYGHKGGYSPHHKAKDLEDNERPNSSNDYNNGNAIVKIGPTQDRRIGSGRFLTRDLTRDANWDYRGHDRDKTSTALEKDNSPSNHHNHSRNSMGGGRYSDRGGGGGSDRIGGGSYVERRPYDRRNIGEEHNRDKDENSHESGSSVNKYNSHNSTHNNTRYNHGLQKSTNGRQRRGGHSFHDRNEEPEWFSEGPTSQLDTIELRGFDEYDEQTNCEINDSRSDQESKRKMSESSSTRSSGSVAYASEQQQADQNKVTPSVFENNSSGDYNNAEESNRTEQGPKYGALSSILDIKEHKLNDDNSNNNDDDDDNEDSHDDSTKKHNPETEFNFDEYLTLDPLDTTLMQNDDNIPIASSAIKSSRFTRWFGNKSNSEESGNKSTSQFNSNFENAKQEDDNSTTNKTLMDFLQGNKIPQNFVNNNRPQVPSITSVEELEARMRKIETPSQNDKRPLDNNLTVTVDSFLNGGQSGESGTPQPHPPPPPTQDLEAFKKLLRQLGTSNQQNNFMENVQVNMLPPPPPPQTQSVPTFAIANFVQPPEDGNPNFLHMQKNPEELSKLMHQHQMFQQQGNQQNLLYPIKLMPPQPRHILINKPPTVVFPPNVPNMFIDPTQKRNEVQNLMQAIARGEISLRFLEQELHNPHSSAQSKEIIATVLRETAQKAGNPHMNAAGSIHAPSPVPMGPGVTQQAPGFLHLNDMLMPGMQLMDGEGFSPQPPPHGPMPNVDMQNNGEVLLGNDGGLIKSQFDEQQQQIDNSKKKQQQQQLGGMSGIQQQQQQQPVRQSPSILSIQQRQNNSPTPLAFTPTSVLRKMTAEKDLNVQQQQNSGVQTPNKTPAALPNFTSMPVQLVQQQQQQQQQQLQLQTSAGVVATQPRMILGGNNVSQHLLQQQQQNAQTQISAQSQQNMALRNAQQQQQQQQQQQMKWQTAAPVINANLHGNKPLGRPILKGPVQNVTQANQLPPLPPHQLNHMPYAQKIDFQQIQLQQQQRLKNNQTPQHMLNPQLFPQLQSPPPPHNPPQQSPNNVLTQLQQQQQFLHQQQMNMQRQQQQQQQQQQQLNVHHNPIMNSTNNAQSNSHGSIMNQRERGTLSPTSNQLAQWFSPELLAQATAGKLPLLNVNQALSLEEFERSIQQHSSAVVHN